MTFTCNRLVGLFAVAYSLSGIAYAQETPKPPETKPADTKPAETQTAPPATTPPAKPGDPVPTKLPAPPEGQTVNTQTTAKPAPPRPKPVQGRVDAPFVPPTTVQKPKPQPKLPANVVARVGNQDISREELLAMFNMVAGRPLVDQLVQASLLQQEADRLHITVSEDELQKAIREAKDRIVSQEMQVGGHTTPMTFKDIAAREGFNDDLIRWSVRLDILRRKTFAKSVEKQVPSRDDQRHLAHIIAATSPVPGPGEEAKQVPLEVPKTKDEEAKAKIDRIYDEIKTGKKSWSEAAKESDDAQNAQNGGDVGWCDDQNLDPDFTKAAFSIAKPGEIAGPVKTRAGWHIIKLIQNGKDLTPAEKLAYRNQQIAIMQSNSQSLNTWLGTLRANKQIVVNRQAQIVPGAKMPARMMQTTPATTAKKPRKVSSQ